MTRIRMMAWLVAARLVKPFSARLWLEAWLRGKRIENRLDGSLARMQAIYAAYRQARGEAAGVVKLEP